MSSGSAVGPAHSATTRQPGRSLSLAPPDEGPPLPRFYEDVDTPKPDPHEEPQRWAIYRGHAVQAPAVDPASPRWIDGLRGALSALDFAPYAAAPPSEDELSSEEDALVWEGEGWEEFYAKG